MFGAYKTSGKILYKWATKAVTSKRVDRIINQITSIKAKELCSEWLLQFYKWHQENNYLLINKIVVLKVTECDMHLKICTQLAV